MFQTVLLLIIGVLIGWNFHIYFMALKPKATFKSQNNTLEKKYIQEECKLKTVIMKDKEQNNSLKNKDIPFKKLLDSGNFNDAMAFYLEANNEQLKEYKLILKVYFYDKGRLFPKKTIDEILYYIDIEPQATDIKIYLAKLYQDIGRYQKAIDLLLDLKNSQDMDNIKKINSSLNQTIENYITKLTKNHDFTTLISLLENIIAQESNNQQYIIQLAQLYYKLDNYSMAKELLEEIDSDSTYSPKAKIILTNIEQKERELEQYTNQIPLTKIGSQYGINVNINNTPLTLLLDTGATYTLVDSDKIPNLIIKEQIILNTAGGEIIAGVAVANNLIVDGIEFKDFNLTVANFKREGVDGLLGMNFFEKFDFKIDQTRQLLYINYPIAKND
jgi:predicted aspartyl protease